MKKTVQVYIASESRFPIGRKYIRSVIKDVIRLSKLGGNVSLEICVVGDRKMKYLNRMYRNLDKTTSVLAFAFEDPHKKCQRVKLVEELKKKPESKVNDKRIFPFVSSPDNILRLGTIVVSYPQARNLAAQDQLLVDEKIVQLVKHGMKYLLGVE